MIARIATGLALGALVIAGPAAAATCSPAAMRALFDYQASTQAVLDVEAAMATAQAAEGVIPAAAAQDIAEKARAELVPEAEFDAEYGRVNHRMVALLNVWRRSLDDLGDQYVHFGATTVDIYGTATMVTLDRAAGALDNCLAASVRTMATLARAHRATPMIGRTLGQHAQPISFGKKISSWIGEYGRHRARLAEVRARIRRSAILKGPVGNYSGLGDRAAAVEQRFAAALGFAAPDAADWNGTRDVIAEYGAVLGLVARSNQRVGQEIFLLQSTDIAEVREALPPGTASSSSMPHKSNPRLSERLIHSGRTIPRLAEVLGDDVVNFFERDNTSAQAAVLAEISITSAAAQRDVAGLLATLEVDSARMRANIDGSRGFAMSQRVALALAAHMPRAAADTLVKTVIEAAERDGLAFAPALARTPAVARHLNAAAIARLLDPGRIEAPALDQIDRVLAEAEAGFADR